MDTSRRPRRVRDAPDEADITEAIRPGYNAQMSLEEASASVAKLARFEPAVVSELPGESLLRIEVNGQLAGAIQCFPDAPGELAVGWAFMNGFFAANAVESVTVHEDRVSVMARTDVDVDRRRLHAVGWRRGAVDIDSSDARNEEPFAIYADVLLDVTREAFRVMGKDRARDGFMHAAVGTDTGVQCVARDQAASLAVAKVIGWVLLDDPNMAPRILFLRGIVDRLIIEAAAHCGICVVVTTGIPTADAFRAATGRNISLLGMASTQRPGVFVDAGHVIEDDLVPQDE